MLQRVHSKICSNPESEVGSVVRSKSVKFWVFKTSFALNYLHAKAQTAFPSPHHPSSFPVMCDARQWETFFYFSVFLFEAFVAEHVCRGFLFFFFPPPSALVFFCYPADT